MISTSSALKIALLGVVGLASPAFAQLVPQETAQPASPAVDTGVVVGQGTIVFERDTENTGSILDTEMGHVEFMFRNIGAGPLTITSIKPSCGCTVPELSKTVYAPNETGVIKIEFDPKGKQGNLARTIQVFTDSTATPSETITVRAHVKPVIVLEPLSVVNFVTLEKGQGGVQEIKVRGRFPEFQVTRASTDDPLNFDVEVVPGVTPVEFDGEQVYEQILRVTVKQDAKPGQRRCEISIRTNEERKSIFSMSAVARILGDLEMNPARMTLGRLSVGDEFEREIRVTSRSGKPFELSAANMSNPAVDVTFTMEPVDPSVRTEWVLKAKGKVLSAAARFNTVVTLQSDIKDEELTEIQMYGQLRPQQ